MLNATIYIGKEEKETLRGKIFKKFPQTGVKARNIWKNIVSRNSNFCEDLGINPSSGGYMVTEKEYNFLTEAVA